MKYIFITYLVFCLFDSSKCSHESCRTPNGEIAYCISIYKCNLFLNTLKNPNLMENTKIFLQKSQCGNDELGPLVCCGSQDAYETSSRFQNSNLSQHIKQSLLPSPSKGECGTYHIEKITNISGQVLINEYPWTALLSYEKNGINIGYKCGGVLINNRYVLTAAHCTVPDFNLGKLTRIRLGEYDTKTDKDCVPVGVGKYVCYDNHYDFNIENIIIHPNFTKTENGYFNDIALIRLHRPIPKTEFIMPICITNKMVSEVNTLSLSPGWGINEYKNSNPTKDACKIYLTSNNDCLANVQISSVQLCAQNRADSKNICYGDDGGALVKLIHDNDKDYFALEGIQTYIIKHGNNSNNIKDTVIYINTQNYNNWILDNLRF